MLKPRYLAKPHDKNILRLLSELHLEDEFEISLQRNIDDVAAVAPPASSSFKY